MTNNVQERLALKEKHAPYLGLGAKAVKKVPVGEGGDRFPGQAPDFNAAP